MTIVGGWVLAPLVLLALSGGAGLLADRVSGARIAGPLVPGVGLAVLVVVAGLLTIADATAELAAPAAAAIALAGFVSSRTRLRMRGLSPHSHLAPIVCGLGAYVLLAWPSVLSGQASVAGYIKLDDSAIWLGLIAHLMDHGRDLAGVPPSTFQLDLKNWLGQGYPVGAFTPVGVTARLSGQDYATVYQPAIAVYGTVAALSLSALAGGGRRGALCALVAVQASLFYGYAQWGSIKEVAAVALIATLVGVATHGGARALLLAAVPAGALLDTYGAGGVIWAGTGMAAAVVLLLVRTGPRAVLAAAGGVVIVAICAVPAIDVLGIDAKLTTGGSPANQEDIGKLVAPLDGLQGAGLWPAGDFRNPVDPHWLAALLAVAGLILAAAAVVLAVRRRSWPLPVTVLVVLVAAFLGTHVGGPWIDAKVLAITAPFLLLAGAASWRLAVIPLGVIALWSTFLAARDVYVAPRDELSELRGLGDQLAGKGPTLVLNYEGYGTRYFLGPAEDEGASDLRYSQVPMRDGSLAPDFATVEVDDVDQAALFAYPAIVRRRTPVGSRPPGGYRTVHAGRYFEAWQRAGALPAEHVSLGQPLAPAAPLTCREARRHAQGTTRLVAAPAVNPVLAGQAEAPRSRKLTVTLPQAGGWRVWVGGSVLGRLRVSVDGKAVGSYHHQLDASVGWLRFDARQLDAGAHRVTLDYARGWRPGRGDTAGQLPLGPVALSLETQPALVRLPSAQVDRLCDGRDYDWLETFR